MINRRAARSWWDLSRGGNVVLGIMTISLGALLAGVGYQEGGLPLALHAFCIGAFIAGWFAKSFGYFCGWRYNRYCYEFVG